MILKSKFLWCITTIAIIGIIFAPVDVSCDGLGGIVKHVPILGPVLNPILRPILTPILGEHGEEPPHHGNGPP